MNKEKMLELYEQMLQLRYVDEMFYELKMKDLEMKKEDIDVKRTAAKTTDQGSV